jgi:hypothetical protein
MKLRLGQYSYDFSGGLVPQMRFVARMARAASEGDLNKMQRIAFKYGRSKLAPVPSAGINALTGKNYIGEPTSAKEEAFGLVTPIPMSNLAEALKAEGIEGAIKASPDFFGISTTRYKTVKELFKEIDKENRKPANTPEEKKEKIRRIKAWQSRIKQTRKYQTPEEKKADATAP